MKTEQFVSLDQWEELYDWAIEFKKLACWNWMYDVDVFGVVNPETGEIGYCSVLGNLGEVFALNVYPGSEGLASWRLLYENADRMPDLDPTESQEIFTSQQCLSMSYEDRAELDKRDLELIRKLGLQFRGRNAWPMFRSYRPGYLPWFLSEAEVRFLRHAVQQTMLLAVRAVEEPDLLEPPEEGKYLVRVLRDGGWVDTWQEPAPLAERKLSPVVNELQVAQLKRQIPVRRGTWEFDCVRLPIVIEEGERPYHPVGVVVMEKSGMAIAFEALAPGTLEKEVPRVFIAALHNAEALPATLETRDKEAAELIGPIAAQLNIDIHRVRTLEGVNSLLSQMDSL